MLRRNLRLKTWLLVGVAFLAIVAGTLVGAVRLLDRAVPGYRAQTADWVSERLGQPLEIGAMELGWTWSGPILEFSDVALLEVDGPDTVLELRELGLHFSFWDLLRGVQRPNGLNLAGVEIALHRNADGTWRLQGLADTGEAETLTPADIDRWLDRVRRVRLEDGRLRVTDAARPAVDLDIAEIAGTLRNNGPRHRARIRARLPEDIGGELELDVFVLGKLERIDELKAHAYARVEDLAAADLMRAAGLGGEDLRGEPGKLEIWSDWRKGHFDGARGSIDLGAIWLARNEAPRVALQPAITIDVSLEPRDEDDGYDLQLDSLRSAGSLPTTGVATLYPDAGRGEGHFYDLPATLAMAWMKLAAPGRFTGMYMNGMVDELRGEYAGSGDWRLGGAFTALSVNDAGSGLNAGEFDGTWGVGDDGGELYIAEGKGAVAADRYLRNTLSLDAIGGRVVWRNTAENRRVEIRDLRIQAAEATIAGGGSLNLPADGPPVADLTFDVASEDIPATLAHIPQAEDLPNPRLRDWLPKAVLSGRLIAGQVRLAGPLDRFPMAGDVGEFRITARAEDVTLAYKPGWPVLTGVAGEMTLEGDDLDIRANRARMLDIAVGPGRAHVANVREPVLRVNGEVRGGDAQRMLSFLAESPLSERFGRLPEILTLKGKTDLALTLSIPLKPELGELKVAGAVRLNGPSATHPALPEPLTDLDGELRFDLKGVYAEGLKGSLSGLPIVASLAPGGDDMLAINAETTIRLPEDAGILAAFKVPENVIGAGSGESRWRIGLEVGGGGRVSDLDLSSDLAGLNLDLPAPLGKSAEAEVPTRLMLAAGRERLRLNYGERLALDLEFADDRLESANAIFGGADIAPPEGPGWWLGGTLDRLDVDAWRRFVRVDDDDEKKTEFRGADLKIAELHVAGQLLRNIDLRVAPLLADDGWHAQLDGTDGHGSLSWFQNPGRDLIQVQLERLRLTPAPKNTPAEERDPIEPAELPLFDVTVGSLALAGRDLGRLELETSAIDDGLAMNRLAVSGGVMDLRAAGDWRRADGLTQASLNGSIRGSGIAALLQTLGYTANLSANETKIDTQLRVDPNPEGLTPATLNGKLSLELRNGRLLAVEPGAGRVLGLVNFYALPRRLLLDFRDVLGKGTAFDELKGNFRIENGDAYTDKLTIETPSADIRIAGRVGLAARDYDQRVTITPQVSSAAAIAGTVIGGPAVGAAMWVAQQLLDRPLGELTRVSYHLTGNWDDPRIEEAKAD